MKVLIAEKIHDDAAAVLRDRGIEPVFAYLPSEAELITALQDVEGVIVRTKVPLPARVLAAAPKLRAIGMHGIGLDHIDLAAAEKQGIAVASVPGGNSDAVAELTMALLLAQARNICTAYNDVREGNWRADMFLGSQLKDKTLGVIAFGRIGRRVAELCRAFGMRVIAYDPLCSPEDAARNNAELVSLDTLYARSDIISVHPPLTPETRHMIGDAAVTAMKPGVIIANLARGGILDEAAMIRGLESGKIRGLCLDVMEQEPPAKDNALLRYPQVVVVPHMGARTVESQQYVGATIAGKVADILLGK